VSYREWTLKGGTFLQPSHIIDGFPIPINETVPVIERAALDAERAAHAQTKAELQLLRDAVNSTVDACTPECDSSGHAEGCKTYDAAAFLVQTKAQAAASEALLAKYEKWARFGSSAFESFWHDGEPNDLDGGELQEMAVECGLLGRTEDNEDEGTTHAELCDWNGDRGSCTCFVPLLGVLARPEVAAINKEVDRG
jgi:hypothetical protein